MGNLRMNADQISYKGGEKPMSVEEAIKNAGNTGLAHTADIAPDFSAESAYNAGDLVYHNGTLYVFTANHAAGAWSSEDTQAVTVGNELSTLMSGLTSKVACVTINIDDVEFPSGRSGDFYANLPSQYATRTIVSAFAYSLSKAIKPYVSYVDNENKRVQYYTENSESSALTRSVTVTFLIV